jgi:hypothetical protein
MTENDLKAFESLAANAPAGPWSVWYGSDTIELLAQSGDPIAVRCPTVPDTMPTIRTFAFLASARAAIPAMASELRRLWALEQRLREIIGQPSGPVDPARLDWTSLMPDEPKPEGE